MPWAGGEEMPRAGGEGVTGAAGRRGVTGAGLKLAVQRLEEQVRLLRKSEAPHHTAPQPKARPKQ